jgi:hypothetical protein
MGWLKNEGEKVDIAVVGRDVDDGLIVQFLSMSHEDPDAVRRHKRDALDLIELMAGHRDWPGGPWKYALRYIGNAANAYSDVRLLARDGQNPLQRVVKAPLRATGFLAMQLPRVEGIGPHGRFVICNDGERVWIQLTMPNERTIKGWLAELSPGHVAVAVTEPLDGSCLRIMLFDPYEDGFLLDGEGILNSYGLEVTVKLTHDIYEAGSAIENRIEDIKQALAAVRVEILAAEGIRAIWEALPGPPLDIDFVFFDSILTNWIWRDTYGLASL